jgi:hypothetical protein
MPVSSTAKQPPSNPLRKKTTSPQIPTTTAAMTAMASI